jgi:carbonic anhydrase
MHLDRILEHNRSFTAGRSPAPLSALEKVELAVVACYDPRLDTLLPQALGIEPGGAFLIRTAGALVQPGSSSLRTLALSVFLFGVTEVIVVGHASCRMAAFDSAAFIDAFRKRGVAREAFGPEDLRAWAGAIPGARRGVELSVANLLAAPVLPRDLSVSGLLLDDASGALDVVVRPGEAPAVIAALAVAPAPQPAEATVAVPAQGHEQRRAPAETASLAEPLAELVALLGSKRELGAGLHRIRAELERSKGAPARLKLIEGFLRDAAAQDEDLADAYSSLRQRMAETRGQWDPKEIVAHFLNLPRRS